MTTMEEYRQAIDQLTQKNDALQMTMENLKRQLEEPLLQKVEELETQLANLQLELASTVQSGEANVEHLERQLMQERIKNAKLVEDNEGFRSLMSDMARPIVEEPDWDLAKVHRENLELKQENQAFAAYISNMMEKLLRSDDCERILDKTLPVLRPLSLPLQQPRRPHSAIERRVYSDEASSTTLTNNRSSVSSLEASPPSKAMTGTLRPLRLVEANDFQKHERRRSWFTWNK